jgi:hypothetical protein
VFLFNVTTNNDWDIYESMFKGDIISNDLLFEIVSDYFTSRGEDFQAVYKFHILLMSIGFFFFISKFSKHIVFVTISLYVLFQIIPLSNQIRYFVAFSFFLLSAYEFVVKKNYITFLLFALISVFSHRGILLMFPFLYFSFVDIDKLLKKLVIFSIILSGVFLVLYVIGMTIFSHFANYFEEKMISSLSGGIFNNLIFLIWILLVYGYNKKLSAKYKNEIDSDEKYLFLYKLSIYSIIFFPPSIYLQIIGLRYIAPLFVVWIIYFLYSLNFYSEIKNRIKQLSILLFLSVFTFMYMYLIPEWLLGIMNFELVVDLIKSNTLLNSL